jgi:galactokinase/mevalonate kinase-like predicted kinase
MLNNIKKFLVNLNPNIIVQAPSRINLVNPLDAVEGDFWMPSMAINGKNDPLSVFLYIKEINEESKLKIYTISDKKNHFKFEIIYDEIFLKETEDIKREFEGRQRLVYASVFRLIEMSSYFAEKFINSNFEMGLLTTIPPQSGLGGSSAIIIAVIYGFTQYFDFFNNLSVLKKNEFPLNKDIIAEIATKVEDEDLNIVAGYSDRYTIARGGLGFCCYTGKLYHRKIANEPLAIYDRIDKTYEITHLPIIICFSGESHESGNVHEKLRTLYLQKESQMLTYYSNLAVLSWKSRFALMNHDWELLGEYFKENTRIMNNIMRYAGFKYGIGVANNILIDIIEDCEDVYGAKLTGAGNGGSVFAIIKPGKSKIILEHWKNKLSEFIYNQESFISKFPFYPLEIREQLKNARFFQITIDTNGVKKL